jgi:hypothetical protein
MKAKLIYFQKIGMNINWDEELDEYFKPKYVKEHCKVGEDRYRIITLEGQPLEF